jgi:hypothetical protein
MSWWFTLKAGFLLLVEAVLLLGVVAVIVLVLRDPDNQCRWFGPGQITIIERYYRDEKGQIMQVVPAEFAGLASRNITLGARLALKKRCYCSGLFAEIHSYTPDPDDGYWREIKLGGVELMPIQDDALQDDMSTLEGKWKLLSPGNRYRVEVRLKCPSQRDETLKVFDYATFIS